jgi:hypothetical protein
MPYNPEAQFNAGLGLVGAQNIAADIAEAQKRYREDQRLGSYNDSIVKHAYHNGLISLEEVNDYNSAAGNKKTGIAAGLMAGMMDDAARQKQRDAEQMQAAQIEHLNAQAFLANQQANEASVPFQPGIVNVPGGPDGKSVPFAITSKHSAQPLHGGDSGSDETIIDPLIDPSTKQPVPGMGVVRKTGQVTRTTTEQPQVTLDPTGKFRWDDKSRSWQPLTPAFIMTPGNEPAAPSASAPQSSASKPKPGDIVRGYRFKGGNPADQNSWELVQ